MEKKMRFGGELLPRKNTFSRIAVCLFLLILSGSRGKSLERVCEFQDANLLFPNTPAGSAGDIRAKKWNKENGIRVASWMEKTNFEPSSLYGDRLMAIGENSIRIQNATRNDTGTYTLILISGSTQKFTEFTLDLEVLVPPTNQCIPNITHENNALRPKLPPDVCGIPMVTSKWKNFPDNISVLNFESGLKPGTYTACANGKSLHCFKGDVDRLCSDYTIIPEIQPQNQSSSMPGGIIAAIIVSVVLIVTIAIVLVCLKKEYFRGKLCTSTTERTMEYDLNEGMALMQVETSENEPMRERTVEYNPHEGNALMGGETPEKESTKESTVDNDLSEGMAFVAVETSEEAPEEAKNILSNPNEKDAMVGAETSQKESTKESTVDNDLFEEMAFVGVETSEKAPEEAKDILFNPNETNAMVDIYCLKCKRYTSTNEVRTVTTTNNRLALTGWCAQCGSTKYKFIPMKSGDD